MSLSPKRKPKLGQNFLVDESTCLRIADALGDVRQRTVVEIGPGHGAITGILAQRAARLHCVELDPGLARELSFRFRDQPNVRIHEMDVLTTDLRAFTPTGTLDVVGNLPYYITSDILLHLFHAARAGTLQRGVIMMQREVAERVAAQPGSSQYGALSAFTQMHARVTQLFTLPPSAFQPPPEVFSSVLRLDFAPRFDELGVDADGFNRLLRAAFAQKRKTLVNNLRVLGHKPAAIDAAWPRGLPPSIRAEAVELHTMAELYRGLAASAEASSD